MSFINDIHLIQQADQLIRFKNTGCPQEFATKLGISRRHWFRIKKIMEEICGCPIAYDSYAKTYYYTQTGRFFFEFEDVK